MNLKILIILAYLTPLTVGGDEAELLRLSKELGGSRVELPESEWDLPEVMSPGAYFTEEEGVHLYDTVFPLIYQYKAPDWFFQRQLQFGIPNCTDDKFSESGQNYLCPIFHHIQNELSNQMDFAMGLQFMTSMQESDLEVTFNCDTVSKHFFSERLQNDKMKNYLAKWKKCSEGKMWQSDVITEYSAKISTSYNTMVKKFMEDYFPQMRTNDRVNKASELNEKSALASLLYTHYLSLVKRWRRGFRDCKKGYIPDSVLSSKRLQVGLDALKRKLGDGKYEFALPHEGGDISRYYKYPITDCVYTSEKFYLRVLVPVIKIRAAPIKLVNIKAIPFYKEVNGAPQLCMLQGFAKGRQYSTSVDNIGKGIIKSMATEVHCDSTNFKLCQMPSSDDMILDPVTDCARALVIFDYDPSPEHEAGIHINCPMHCTELRPERLPLLVKANDKMGTIYAIGNPKKEEGIEFSCYEISTANTEDETIIEQPKNLPAVGKGVLAFTIPCMCWMRYGSTTLRSSFGDCAMDLLAFKITPFHFVFDPTLNQKEVSNTPVPVIDPDDAV